MDMSRLWHELDTMQIQMDQIEYECRICDNSFTSPIQLTVHCIVLHKAKPCIHCLKLFADEHSLNDHIRFNHAAIARICIDCSVEFVSEREFYFHLIRVHFKKECHLCDALVSFDEHQIHMANAHQVINYTPLMRLDLSVDQQNQYNCQLCHSNKSVDRLEKMLSHLLFYHKSSLQSLLRCLLNDNALESIGSSDHTDNDNRAKCSVCGIFYIWTIPKHFHQIYCQGFIYCYKCNISFKDQSTFIEHSTKCVHQTREINFCNNCNTADELHLKNVHNFSSARIGSNISSLMSLQNDCHFCGRNLNTESKHLHKLIQHFYNLHKFNAWTILRLLCKRNGNIQLNDDVQKSSNKTSAEILTIFKHNEKTDIEYLTDFDATLVKYVYSSVSDYDSSECENDERPSVKAMYQCVFCKTRSKSKFVHAMHMHKKHGFQMKTPEFRCNVCRKLFKSNRCLKTHNQNIHHKLSPTAKRFLCPFCAYGCNGKYQMRQHIGEHVEASYHPCTSKNIGFNCRYCHFIFWTKEKLNEHQLSRHSDSVSETYMLCNLCFFAFNNLKTLRAHHWARHAENQPLVKTVFQCIICRIAFLSIDEIRQHMHEMHTEHRSTYCARMNCMQIVSDQNDLNAHWTNEHANSTFQCLKCFKMFKRREFAQNHLAKDHAKWEKAMEM